jgi:hypothetical protein
MDKGQLDCDIMITCYFIETAITIISKNWAFKLGSKINPLETLKHNYNLEAMKFLYSFTSIMKTPPSLRMRILLLHGVTVSIAGQTPTNPNILLQSRCGLNARFAKINSEAEN